MHSGSTKGHRVGLRNASPRRFSFTKQGIDELPRPTRRRYYYDAKVRALAIAVNPSGAKSFYLYKKIARRPERVFIGAYPDFTIEQARKHAAKLLGEIADGKNPADRRRLVRAEMTLGELFEAYKRLHLNVNKASTRREAEGLYKRYLEEKWKDRRISDLRRIDVSNLHAQIGEANGHYAANRLVMLLRSMYYRARDWEWQGENPAARFRKFQEFSRKRFLQPDEAPKFFQALVEEKNETLRDYILVSLFTGARQANVLAMRWEDINLDRSVWRIPETKAGEPQDVALSPEALAILDARLRSRQQSRQEALAAIAGQGSGPQHPPKWAIDSPWVFPGPGQTGHLVGPRKPWARILKRAGLKDLRLHDLRRTLGSWQAMLGSSLLTIGASLGHTDLHSTQVYARLNLDPVRKSVEGAVAAIAKAGGFKVLPAAGVSEEKA